VKELEDLEAIFGNENPAFARLFALARRDPSRMEFVRRAVERRLRAHGKTLEDVATIRRSVDLPEDGLSFGTIESVVGEQSELRLPIPLLNTHAFLGGPTGSGKTTQAMRLVAEAHRAGVPSLIFDPVGEWRRLAMLLPPGEVCVLSPGENLGLNPLDPPPGVPQRDWDGRLANVCRQSLWLRDGSQNLLLECLHFVRQEWEARRKIGDIPKGENPCLQELWRALTRRDFALGSRNAGYRETLLSRFFELSTIGSFVFCHKSTDLAALAQRTVVLELKMTGPAFLFVAYLLLAWLDAWLRWRPRNSALRLVVVEEGHLLVGLQLKERADLQDLVPNTLFRTLRGAGGGLLLLDQVPSQIPVPILANTLTKAFFRLTSAPCAFTVASTLGLDPQEREAFARLEPREMLVSWPRDSRPFVIRVPETILPPVPEDDVLVERQAALASLCAFTPCPNGVEPPKTEPKQKAPKEENKDGLTKDERDELEVLAAGPATPQDVCDRLGWDRSRENRTRAKLVDAGFLERIETVGNKRRVLALAKRGKELCEGLGMKPSRFHSNGAHEYVVRLACAGLTAAFPDAEVKRSGAWNGVQPDAALLEESWAVAVQACWSRNAPEESAAAHGLLLAADAKAFSRVVLIARDETYRRAMEKALRTELGCPKGTALPERLVLLTVEGLLAQGFSWHEALGVAS